MIHGSIVALITPFRDGQLDETALRHMVDWHIEQGTHGIVPVGTTGESPTLTHDEHCRVIETVVQQAAGRVPVIAAPVQTILLKLLNILKLLNEQVLMQLYMLPVITTVLIRKACISISNWYMTRQLFLLFCTTFHHGQLSIFNRRLWLVWQNYHVSLV
jgi:Dihydrodipicolinate synthase/N-acetylneuraminate lyase